MTTPLQIGKFYLTRDGNKVGPVRRQGDYFRADNTIGSGLVDYTEDGISAFKGVPTRHDDHRRHMDIVAEWTDAPAEPAEPAEPSAETRLADAAERIASALEMIAAHLAPVTAVRPASYQQPIVDPAPAENPWIEWPGGDRPVDAGCLVDVKGSGGGTAFGAASDFDWARVRAYRLATPGQTP